MEGYQNNFDIALGLTETPLQTLKDIRHNDELKKNRNLMDLVKQMLAGFKKWMRIAYISAVKGLNPFGSDKNAVECGHYDYRKTEEFKHLRNMVAHQMGINKAYFRDEILDQYKVISFMYKEKGLGVGGLTLTSEGFFHDANIGRTITVVTPEQNERLKEFVKGNPKYENEKFVWHKMSSGEVVVNADNVAVKAFLEKEFLGREAKSRDSKDVEAEIPETEDEFLDKQKVRQANEPVSPGQKFTDGEYEYTFTKDEKVTINRYVGNNPETKLPEGVVVNGQKYPVTDMMVGAFVGTPIKNITINALYWNDAMFTPSCFISGPTSMPSITWENLTPEQEQQLDENRQWAATIPRDEMGLPLEDGKPVEMEEESPEQDQKPQKSKDMGMDI